MVSEQRKTEERRGTGFLVLVAQIWKEPETPRSFTRYIFRVVFDFLSSFFAPRPQRKRLLRRLARALVKHGLDQWTVALLFTFCLYL